MEPGGIGIILALFVLLALSAFFSSTETAFSSVSHTRLKSRAKLGDRRAQLALDMFHYWVAKVAGSYAAAMNGVDAIIFTAGVGENDKAARAGICEYFGYLGVTIDPEANAKRGQDVMISTPDSKVKVFVIPTNEELVIARDTREIVG